MTGGVARAGVSAGAEANRMVKVTTTIHVRESATTHDVPRTWVRSHACTVRTTIKYMKSKRGQGIKPYMLQSQAGVRTMGVWHRRGI